MALFTRNIIKKRRSNIRPVLFWLSYFIALFSLSACDAGTTIKATTLGVSPTPTIVAGEASLTGPVIRIYFSLPLSSDVDLFTSYKRAGQIAIDEQTGGTGKIGQYRIDFVVVDDASPSTHMWNTDLESANATRAAADPDTMVYLGPVNSGAVKVALPIMNLAGIALISPGATYPGLTRASSGITRLDEPELYYPNKIRNFFRVVAPDTLQTPVIGEFFKTSQTHKVYLIDDSQLYGRGLADALTLECTRKAIDCSHRSSITGQEANYQALAASIKAVKADFIFFGGVSQQQAPLLIKDIRAAGLKMPFMGGGALRYDLFIQQAGQDAEGVYAINSGTPEENAPPIGQEFLKRYRALYGETGLNQAYTRQAYDCMNVALTVIKQTGKDRKAIIDGLAHLKNYDGALGSFHFDAFGDTSLTEFTIWQVAKGRWQPIQVLRPTMANNP